MLGTWRWELEHVQATMAGVYFYGYMIIVFLSLINMFISILQESYEDVCSTMEDIEGAPNHPSHSLD